MDCLRRAAITALGLSLILVGGCQTNSADSRDNIFRVRDTLTDMAFDPLTYFPSDEYRDYPTIRILYTAHDYRWPVYAIAVFEGCIYAEGEAKTLESKNACRSNFRARVVRLKDADNPDTKRRYVARDFIDSLVANGASSRSAIRSRLNKSDIEWLEADLNECPSASQALSMLKGRDWMPSFASSLTMQRYVLGVKRDDGMLEISGHGDDIDTTISSGGEFFRYIGYAEENTPSEWAEQFYSSLTTCLQPAVVPAPWNR